MFFELWIIVLFVWQVHDTIFETALGKRFEKFNGYTTKEVLSDPRTGFDFGVVFVLSLIGSILEFITLVYLALKHYIYPFSAITLGLFVMAWIVGIIKSKLKPESAKRKDVLEYDKPRGFYKIYRLVLGIYVSLFYFLLLISFFI